MREIHQVYFLITSIDNENNYQIIICDHFPIMKSIIMAK
ncbi:hypothetical protein D083_0180 [Dickeya solani RNS 08.23.3.1.A]|nr:hypothetical protein D083_0180 [Dickeya solani RNS 08.23.3.1.A]